MSQDALDPHVQSVAVIAAWCESPAHLLQPSTAEALQAEPFRQVCQIVARNWDCSESVSPALRAELEAQAEQAAAAAAASAARSQPVHLSAAEISQRSVDLLLREYYQMMRAKQRMTSRHSSDELNALSQLFLLVCPAGPACCDLRQILTAVLWAAHAAATLTVFLACVIIPMWLVGVRQLLQQQQVGWALALATLGVLLLLGADTLHKSAAAHQHATAAGAVTARTIRQQTAGVGDSPELAALAQASQAGPKTNKSSNSAQQQSPPLSQGMPVAAETTVDGSSPAPPSGTISTPSYLSLLPQVSQLQNALGISSGEAPTSRERLQQEIIRLCQVMGVPATSDKLSTPAAMSATLAELKQGIGIQ